MILSCSGQLKNATLKAHQQTENLMMPMLKAIDNTESYVDVLKMMYGFYKPLEEQIKIVISAAILPDIEQRHKSALAKNDVISSGEKSNYITAGILPVINSIAQGFGAMYVLEGSTLGGVYISRMLKQNDALQNISLTFFNSYGEHTGGMWKTFKTIMDKTVTSQDDIDEAVHTANDTFVLLQKWMLSYPKMTTKIQPFARC
ncbi:MAG: biliverdin-producing heme oxygenase [Ginsengibacter sp.]